MCARCGELLEQTEEHNGGDRRSTGRKRPNGRGAVATDAGLSERQRKDAPRIASIPAAEFEAAVESRRRLLLRLHEPLALASLLLGDRQTNRRR